MSYASNMFRALALKHDAFSQLRKGQRPALYLFFAFAAIFTILLLPLIAVIVSLSAIFGGGGPLTQVLPQSLPALLITLFIIYFIIVSALALFFVYVLFTFSRAFGSKATFRELLALWTPAFLPVCLVLLPLFVVLTYGFFGGTMSDATGTAIGYLFNIMLVALPLFSLLYTVFALRTTKLSWGRAVSATVLSFILFLMLGAGVYLLMGWLL
jgi:hypothetical protein